MTFSATDRDIDQRLAGLAVALPFLLLITPTNAAACRREFLAGDHTEPKFAYRHLPDLDRYRRQLSEIDPAHAEEPILRHFFTALKRELSLRIEMIAHRGTETFREASIELFGHVEPSLVDLADRILSRSVPQTADGERVGSHDLVRHCAAEVAHYQRDCAHMGAVEQRKDITGLMVENGNLLIGADTVLARQHAEAVVHHEVGVHMLTFANGHAQPLRILGTGLAHYDETQEALGLIAEYLAGGLRPGRLRILAARVIAAAHLSEDPTFAATYQRIRDAGLSAGAAFTTAMRARRAGGLTKDAIYLRGLVHLLDYLARGGGLESLFIGKMSLEDLPLIDELRCRGLLIPPPLRPRFLDIAGADERLHALKAGMNPLRLGGLTA